MCLCDTPYPEIRRKVKNALSYSTVKMVKIDSTGLGCLHLTLLLCIVGYVLVFPLLYETKYMAFAKPVGSVRFNLQAPTVLDSNGSPCQPTSAKARCNYDFTPVTQLPYCLQYNGSSPALQQLQCVDWDAFNVVNPVTGQSMYITTRVRENNETLVCSNPGPGSCSQTYAFDCQPEAADGLRDDVSEPDLVQGALPDGRLGTCTAYQQRKLFMADIERFTLLIEHSVQSSQNEKIQADIGDMTGHLVSCSGAKIQGQRVSTGQEFFTVKQLLDAASFGARCGVDLDMASTVSGSDHSVRYDGVSMTMNIVYSNTKPFSGPQGRIAYEYHVSALWGAKSKSGQEIFTPFPNKRTVRDQAGIKLAVSQGGQLGEFSFNALFLQLSTSVAMLAVATVLVDILATTCLPHRKAYQQAKNEEYQFGPNSKFLLLVENHPDGTRRLSRRRTQSGRSKTLAETLNRSQRNSARSSGDYGFDSDSSS